MNKSYDTDKTYTFISLLDNQGGVALLMVMGVVTILTYLLADFVFSTNINKIKAYNYQDKTQARLTAESGLNLALTNLTIYQVGRNKLEAQDAAKSAFPPSELENIIMQPFVYPIPLPKTASIIQKTALNDFEKENLLVGELTVTYSKISGFLNPNALRLPVEENKSNQDEDMAEEEPEVDENGDEIRKESAAIVYSKLVETLERLIKEKSDEDELFHEKFSNVKANELVDEINFYVNSPEKTKGQKFFDAQNRFEQKKITPKHSRMTSLDEMYLLPSWDDELVNLIKDRLSIHEVSIISINEITKEDLKILFPNINDVQIEEFFKYRDGDPEKNIEAKKFKGLDDFKTLITGTLNIVSDSEFTKRLEELQTAGLTIDTAGKLYKVTSQAKYNNATVTLVAFIDLPIKIEEQKQKKKTPNPNADPESEEDDPSEIEENRNQSNKNKNEEEAKKPLELLSPRVIEIRLQ